MKVRDRLLCVVEVGNARARLVVEHDLGGQSGKTTHASVVRLIVGVRPPSGRRRRPERVTHPETGLREAGRMPREGLLQMVTRQPAARAQG